MMNLLFIKSSTPFLSKSVFFRFEIAWLTLLVILLMLMNVLVKEGEAEQGRNTRNTAEARADHASNPNKQQRRVWYHAMRAQGRSARCARRRRAGTQECSAQGPLGNEV